MAWHNGAGKSFCDGIFKLFALFGEAMLSRLWRSEWLSDKLLGVFSASSAMAAAVARAMLLWAAWHVKYSVFISVFCAARACRLININVEAKRPINNRECSAEMPDTS